MLGAAFPSLQQALDSLAQPGLLIGYRAIAPGDELALLEEETRSMDARGEKPRRASGAARIVARDLLMRLGYPSQALPKGPSGAPVWPSGISGSLAHDEQIAVAAVGHGVGHVGIDFETAEPLPPEMMELVATPGERAVISDDPHLGKLLFVAKEAVYKAVHPLDGLFLEFQDIAIDVNGGHAVTRNGRRVKLRYGLTASETIALALA